MTSGLRCPQVRGMTRDLKCPQEGHDKWLEVSTGTGHDT